MKEEHRKYAEEVYDIINHAAKNIGARLPGSDGEKKFAAYMGDKLRGIGIEPVREEFAVSPRASIGGIPYAGWVGLALSALVYIAMGIPSVWYGMALVSIAVIVWLVCSVFLYKTWFDMFFKQEVSQNTYGELLPEDGKYDYTIILSGHTDTSWNWRHSEHASKFAELIGEVVWDTKTNLMKRMNAESGACEDKMRLARMAKEENLDAVHDTVHEMAKDEARHGRGFEGLLKRYFNTEV